MSEGNVEDPINTTESGPGQMDTVWGREASQIRGCVA